MKNIEILKNKAILHLNRNFYTKKAVLVAMQVFTDDCWMNIESLDEAFVVHIQPKELKADIEKLGYEFFNLTLGIMHDTSKDL